MKKIIVIAACLFSITTAVNAQEPAQPKTRSHSERNSATPEQRAQKQVDRITAEVGLTDDQKPKVYDLTLAKVKQMDELKAKYKGVKSKEAETEMNTAKKEYREKVKALLTAEQVEKAKAKAQEMKAAKKESALDAQD